jgi:AraC-like DNA-binding protein
MHPVPLVRITAVLPFVGFLRIIGAPAERLIEKSRLPVRALEQPELLVPFDRVNQFVEDAARTQGVPDFGVRALRGLSPLDLGAFGRSMQRGGTLGRAIEISHRLRNAFNSGVRATMTRQRDQLVLQHRVTHSGARTTGQVSLMVLGLTLNLMRSVAGPGWRPRRIDIAAPPSRGIEEIPELADAEIHFGQLVTTVAIPVTLLSLPLPRAASLPGTEADWIATAPARDFTGSVRQFVVTLLRAGCPDVQLAAEGVGLRTRTFQRRLHEEGTSYGHLLAEARRDLACHLLRDPDRKIIDVAFDLGYSDPAHFTRAFCAWTGLAPREYRNAWFSSAWLPGVESTSRATAGTSLSHSQNIS